MWVVILMCVSLPLNRLLIRLLWSFVYFCKTHFTHTHTLCWQYAACNDWLADPCLSFYHSQMPTHKHSPDSSYANVVVSLSFKYGLTHTHTKQCFFLNCSIPSQCYLCSLCLLCVPALLPRVMGPERLLFQVLSIKPQCRLIKMSISITLNLLASQIK